jgi:hypothetical protein
VDNGVRRWKEGVLVSKKQVVEGVVASKKQVVEGVVVIKKQIVGDAGRRKKKQSQLTMRASYFVSRKKFKICRVDRNYPLALSEYWLKGFVLFALRTIFTLSIWKHRVNRVDSS